MQNEKGKVPRGRAIKLNRIPHAPDIPSPFEATPLTEIEAFLRFTASKKKHQAEGVYPPPPSTLPGKPGRYSSIIIEEEEGQDAISRTI